MAEVTVDLVDVPLARRLASRKRYGHIADLLEDMAICIEAEALRERLAPRKTTTKGAEPLGEDGEGQALHAVDWLEVWSR